MGVTVTGGGTHAVDMALLSRSDSSEPHKHRMEKMVTQLDFYLDVKEEWNAANKDKEDAERKPERDDLVPLPLTYTDEEDYESKMIPLFREELKSSLQRSKVMSMLPKCEWMVQQSYKRPSDSGTGFCHISVIREEYENFKRQFPAMADTMFYYNTGDIVLLTDSEDPQIAGTCHALCVVEKSWGNSIELRTVIEMELPRTVNLAREVAKRESRHPDAKLRGWYVAKVDNLSTATREWIAMCQMPQMPLRDCLLNWTKEAAINDPSNVLHISDSLKGVLQKKYNDSQFQAIMKSLKQRGITLVQGPPGTGKSTTILGIISVLINSIQVKARDVDGLDREDQEGVPLYLRGKPKRLIHVPKTTKEERLQQMKRMSPWYWNNGDYVPWMDDAPNDVNAGLQIRDFAKLPKSSIKEMSVVNETSNQNQYSKVLVCAPSNVAVDEIVRRIAHDGLYGTNGKVYKPVVVRLGPGVHHDLRQFSLEVLAQERAFARGLKVGSGSQGRQVLDPIKHEILQEANVVCATCSVAGSRDVLTFGSNFESVVIDEAAQGVELSTLIPLQTGCKRLVLVGDPKQLPATVFSEDAKRKNYDKSLFQRLMEDSYPVEALTTQYRMHPFISAFPAKQFYNDELKNFRDKNQYERDFHAPWHELPFLPPMCFFNLENSIEQETSMSFMNEVEADFCLRIFKMLSILYPHKDWTTDLGIISPYEKQVKFIKQKFKTLYKLKEHDVCPVEVKTVDGFQGSEKEVIIISVVRGGAKSIGFVKDARRMNVALTRARRSLFVIGNAPTLCTDTLWERMVTYTQRLRGGYIDVHDEKGYLVRQLRRFLRNNRNRWDPEAISKKRVNPDGVPGEEAASKTDNILSFSKTPHFHELSYLKNLNNTGLDNNYEHWDKAEGDLKLSEAEIAAIRKREMADVLAEQTEAEFQAQLEQEAKSQQNVQNTGMGASGAAPMIIEGDGVEDDNELVAEDGGNPKDDMEVDE